MRVRHLEGPRLFDERYNIAQCVLRDCVSLSKELCANLDKQIECLENIDVRCCFAKLPRCQQNPSALADSYYPFSNADSPLCNCHNFVDCLLGYFCLLVYATSPNPENFYRWRNEHHYYEDDKPVCLLSAIQDLKYLLRLHSREETRSWGRGSRKAPIEEFERAENEIVPCSDGLLIPFIQWRGCIWFKAGTRRSCNSQAWNLAMIATA